MTLKVITGVNGNNEFAIVLDNQLWCPTQGGGKLQNWKEPENVPWEKTLFSSHLLAVSINQERVQQKY